MLPHLFYIDGFPTLHLRRPHVAGGKESIQDSFSSERTWALDPDYMMHWPRGKMCCIFPHTHTITILTQLDNHMCTLKQHCSMTKTNALNELHALVAPFYKIYSFFCAAIVFPFAWRTRTVKNSIRWASDEARMLSSARRCVFGSSCCHLFQAPFLLLFLSSIAPIDEQRNTFKQF
jgi:hypothetical protein